MPNLKWQINVLVQQLEKLNNGNGEGGEAALDLLCAAAAVPPSAQVADRTFLDQPYTGTGPSLNVLLQLQLMHACILLLCTQGAGRAGCALFHDSWLQDVRWIAC